jgi:ATP-dependent Clp protease ATP-binding subunit ClpA
MDIENITDWGVIDDPAGREKKGPIVDWNEVRARLKDRVKGQDHVIDDVVALLRLRYAEEKRERPVANLLFLGPTGTGKTELAKGMAETLFKGRMLRFDCSELKGSDSVARLIGVSTGYVGAEKGGQLTRSISNNKRQLIVFDEIEKANPAVFDLFLQMMGDGRLTEQGSGRTADFTQCIILLTSNAENEAILKYHQEMDDPDERVNAIKSHLTDSKVFRGEILGRIDRICVFHQLSGPIIARIAAQKMVQLAEAYGLELCYIDPHLILEAMRRGDKLARFGIRELQRGIESMFADPMVAAKEQGSRRIRLDLAADGSLKINPAE